MLDLLNYCAPSSLWPGICSFVLDHKEAYDGITEPLSDDDLLKLLKNNAKSALPPKDYDSFRKGITSLRKNQSNTLKKENLYRLCFVLKLESDTQAQDLFLNYLHQNELYARSLDEFILIAALKLKLSWQEARKIRDHYNAQISSQPIAPSELKEGDTAETYYTVINETIQNREDLICFLDEPQNLDFFALTRNTQYLALFDDVEPEIIYHANGRQIISLVTDYGSLEKESMLTYYHSLFGMQDDSSEASLSEQEISSLCTKFEQVFMTYESFCLLIQRKRPIDISAGTFLLSLIKKLLAEETDFETDFYVNFLDSDEFIETCNDILIYFGFPALNPDVDNFERLLLDVYQETLAQNPSITNAQFQRRYLSNLRMCLKQIASL